MMWTRGIMAIGLATLLSGCVAASVPASVEAERDALSFTAKPGMARLYLSHGYWAHMDDGQPGPLHGKKLGRCWYELNGVKLGTISDDSYMMIDLLPGKYTALYCDTLLASTVPLQLELKEGDVFYARSVMSLNTPSFLGALSGKGATEWRYFEECSATCPDQIRRNHRVEAKWPPGRP